MSNQRVKRTTDLPLMAYYLMKGLKLARIERKDKGGGGDMNAVFCYLDPEDQAESLRVEWINSPFRDYDNAVRSLKKLCAELRRGGKRKSNGQHGRDVTFTHPNGA